MSKSSEEGLGEHSEGDMGILDEFEDDLEGLDSLGNEDESPRNKRSEYKLNKQEPLECVGEECHVQRFATLIQRHNLSFLGCIRLAQNGRVWRFSREGIQNFAESLHEILGIRLPYHFFDCAVCTAERLMLCFNFPGSKRYEVHCVYSIGF